MVVLDEQGMVDIRQRILGLSPRKRALLAARNPLSFSQERLWVLDQIEGGSAAYNLLAALSLAGHLNLPALTGSLNEVVQRHEVLRTSFAAPDGRPMQVVHPRLRAVVPVVDLGSFGPEEGEGIALGVAGEEVRRPFDLARGPLLRALLFRLGPQRHIFLLTLHHIVSDGWSVDLLIRELSVLYRVFSRGEPSPLPELPIQYADFARWQREHLSGAALEKHLAYWTRHLAGAPPVLELATDRPRPKERSGRGACLGLVLPAAVGQGIKRLGQWAGTTLFTTLLTAFAVLLSRLSGQEDVVLGSPVSTRAREEVEPLIGFFLNILCLRVDLAGDPSFLGELARVRRVVLDGQEHQDLPFERLVEELQPERTLSHAPLFQAVFNLLPRPQQKLDFPGLHLTPLPLETGASQYDLTLSMMDLGEGLLAQLEYSTELFDSATVRRLVEQLAALLRGAIAEPERRLSELPLLGPAERHQLLHEWGESSREALPSLPVHRLFAERAARSADAVAVSCGERI